MKKIAILLVLLCATAASGQDQMQNRSLYGTDFQFVNVGIGGVSFGEYFLDRWQYSREELAQIIGVQPNFRLPYCDVYVAAFKIILISEITVN